MQSIRQIQELNKRELAAGVSPEASWHADYRDTAYIYIGGLPTELSEGDVVAIFSQFGEPTYINLIRDKETGKSKGFAFLKYEDQRSTDLAVDNLGGTVILGRTLKVDHTRYKKKDDETEEGHDLTQLPPVQDEGKSRRKRREASGSESEDQRPMLKEERELARLIQEHDDEDPMKGFLIDEKKEEVIMAIAKLKDRCKLDKSKSRHHHRSRRPKEKDYYDGALHSRHRSERQEKSRSRSGQRSPNAGASRLEHNKQSGYTYQKDRGLKSRQRSPDEEDLRNRGGRDRVNKRPRRREGSVEDTRHPSRRYS
ncbi:RNA binding domain protein [Diplocarpon rosae]|nr:RNA binding domain protein [Diplocarpon rosae]